MLNYEEENCVKATCLSRDLFCRRVKNLSCSCGEQWKEGDDWRQR